MQQIAKYKHDIATLKRQLEGELNEPRIAELENQSRYLAKRIREVEADNLALRKVERHQAQALHSVTSASTAQADALKSEIKELREKHKALLMQQKQEERILKEQHERCVDLEDKCRKLRAAPKPNKTPDPPAVTEDSLRLLQKQIQEVEQAKQEEETRLRRRIREVEEQIQRSRDTLDVTSLKLKEKDQECRLAVLKIKELRRAARLQPRVELNKHSDA